MNATIAPTKTQRYQITLPKTGPITGRIESLMNKYEGMSLTEILKLSIIQLDNATPSNDMDETDYIKSDPDLYAHLLKTKADIEDGKFVAAKTFSQKEIDML
jgi:hypothetical protein